MLCVTLVSCDSAAPSDIHVISHVYPRQTAWKPHKRSHLPRGYSSCSVDQLLMSRCSRRPFPAGDRVTFNGKDCLCQYCVEPMSPGPKDILGSSSKYPLPAGHMHTAEVCICFQMILCGSNREKGSLGRGQPSWPHIISMVYNWTI